jgi:hypothetical protein
MVQEGRKAVQPSAAVRSGKPSVLCNCGAASCMYIYQILTTVQVCVCTGT